jgi:hypothetical protein
MDHPSRKHKGEQQYLEAPARRGVRELGTLAGEAEVEPSLVAKAAMDASAKGRAGVKNYLPEGDEPTTERSATCPLRAASTMVIHAGQRVATVVFVVGALGVMTAMPLVAARPCANGNPIVRRRDGSDAREVLGSVAQLNVGGITEINQSEAFAFQGEVLNSGGRSVLATGEKRFEFRTSPDGKIELRRDADGASVKSVVDAVNPSSPSKDNSSFPVGAVFSTFIVTAGWSTYMNRVRKERLRYELEARGLYRIANDVLGPGA